MDKIPVDVVVGILAHIPMELWINMLLVCKSWNQVFSAAIPRLFNQQTTITHTATWGTRVTDARVNGELICRLFHTLCKKWSPLRMKNSIARFWQEHINERFLEELKLLEYRTKCIVPVNITEVSTIEPFSDGKTDAVMQKHTDGLPLKVLVQSTTRNPVCAHIVTGGPHIQEVLFLWETSEGVGFSLWYQPRHHGGSWLCDTGTWVYGRCDEWNFGCGHLIGNFHRIGVKIPDQAIETGTFVFHPDPTADSIPEYCIGFYTSTEATFYDSGIIASYREYHESYYTQDFRDVLEKNGFPFGIYIKFQCTPEGNYKGECYAVKPSGESNCHFIHSGEPGWGARYRWVDDRRRGTKLNPDRAPKISKNTLLHPTHYRNSEDAFRNFWRYMQFRKKYL